MLVQLRDQAGIGFIKLQKCLAPSDLLRGDGLAREIHSPASRYVAADGDGDVRLACLLAQYFFHDMPQPLFILVYVLRQTPVCPLPLLLSSSRAHAIAQWRCAEGFAKHPIQIPLRPAPSFTDQTKSHPRSTV